MRLLICSLLLATVWLAIRPADAQPFHAGITRITVQDEEPFDALIAYPTQAAEAAVTDGPFILSASRHSPIATNGRFPIVLFSHGSGRGPGTPLIHSDLLLHLARTGFIVAAPFHPGSRRPFVARPRQIRKALEQFLADARFAKHADSTRIGMIGFSFGGAVALLVAGATANLAHLSDYCRDHRNDPRACDGIPTDGSWANAPKQKSTDAIPLRAIILLEPYGALFDRDGLASVDLAVLIYNAQQSDLRVEGNALALAQALPRRPEQVAVPGGHFVFVDPCLPALASQAPQICRDPTGVDRSAVHQLLNTRIADFLRRHL